MRIEEILLHLDLDDINQLFLICFSLKPILSYSNQHLDISIHFFKEMMYSLGIYETNMVREPIIALDAINHKITDELIERYKVIRDSL